MKVKIKKTGEIVNAADYARVALDQCDSWGSPIELPLDEIELIPEDTSSEEIERRRRVAALAEKLYVAYNTHGANVAYASMLDFAHVIIDKEDKYIKEGVL